MAKKKEVAPPPDLDKLRMEVFRRSPMTFRESIMVDAGNSLKSLKEVMAPVQREDFAARDACMLWVARVPEYVKGKPVERKQPPIRQFYTQRSRGYSKTSDIALDMLWLCIFSANQLSCHIAAEDIDQAMLIIVQASKIVDANPWLKDHIEIQRKVVVGKNTGTRFTCLTSDVNSGLGLTSDVIIADEFSAWTKEPWWDVIYSTFAKKDKMLIVGCNALVTGSWQIDKREQFKRSPDWYVSIPDGYAPWYNERTIQNQREGISYLEFQRLWMNRDAASGNKYLEDHWVDRAVDEGLERQESGSEYVPTYFVAVDYAERTDRTVVTVSHLYDGEVIIDRMDVVDPLQREGGTILVTDVIEKLDEIDLSFGHYSHVTYIFDRWNMAHVIQVLRRAGKDVIEFEFQSGVGNHQASVLLQQYLMQGKLKFYPGCGEMYDESGDIWQPQGVADDLAAELKDLIIKDVNQGKRWRFDHVRNKHDDRAFTVAVTVKTIHDLLMAEADDDYYESEGANG